MSGRMPILAAVASTALISVPPLHADTSDLCFEVGAAAGALHGVPAEVMAAITLTETGRDNRPWPWAINAGGDGRWFETRADALAWARELRGAGRQNFDVGCFQLNYRWHHTGFPSLEAMFDPAANADYAARYLAQHYRTSGDWSVAAGRYHSGTPVHASRYRGIFDRHLARLAKAPVRIARAIAPRVNSFPLLQTPSAPGQLGSLVSTGTGPTGPSLFAAGQEP